MPVLPKHWFYKSVSPCLVLFVVVVLQRFCSFKSGLLKMETTLSTSLSPQPFLSCFYS